MRSGRCRSHAKTDPAIGLVSIRLSYNMASTNFFVLFCSFVWITDRDLSGGEFLQIAPPSPTANAIGDAPDR